MVVAGKWSVSGHSLLPYPQTPRVNRVLGHDSTLQVDPILSHSVVKSERMCVEQVSAAWPRTRRFGPSPQGQMTTDLAGDGLGLLDIRHMGGIGD